MKSAFKAALLFVLISLCWFACGVDPVIREELPADNIHLVVPAGWPYPLNDFSQDPLNRDGFVLGRKLFYDTQLSSDNSISCGSCHQQFVAFSNRDQALSTGVNGMSGTRNAPALFNLNWQPELMWDGSIPHLLDQPLSPISNPLEMNESLERILLKLNTDADYRRLFKATYGSENITADNLKKAFSQFMGMLVSADSRYDHYLRGDLALSESEQHGLSVFQTNCARCHPSPLFSSYAYFNNGLDSTFTDPGRALVTGLASDSGKFKVPSLRNVAISKPYMHDGRFETLEEVLDHYTGGIKFSSSLDTGLAGGITLNNEEKEDIIAFLKTLTDEHFIRDKRFNDPFNN